jgi:hypothetical protein
LMFRFASCKIQIQNCNWPANPDTVVASVNCP